MAGVSSHGHAAAPKGGAGQKGSVENRKRLCVCMVSDFFYPGFGGVEIHIYNLACCLVEAGVKVIIVTRHYGERQGVRWITKNIKVYHVPLFHVPLPPGTVTLPTVYSMFPILRQIFIREEVDLVHGHQTTSNMAHEAMMHATTMGIPTVFTDHSLFGFADGASIHINKVLEWSLSHVGHVVCVSHTCRENTVLRARIPPTRVSVIPNATDPVKFYPSDESRGKTWGAVLAARQQRGNETGPPRITIVAVTRLVYRKGADLLADVVPIISEKYPHVDWVIGGDGPRMLQLEQMVERCRLFDRVTLLGQVDHPDVPDILRRGQIFLNTSLTEAFCIAICEAAACGHLVVSTKVGGVPEVMPRDMLLLAEPCPKSLVGAVADALGRVANVRPWEHHRRIAQMYNWQDISRRTAKVYEKVLATPLPTVAERIYRGLSMGFVYGLICAGLTALDHFIWVCLRVLSPASSVPRAANVPRTTLYPHPNPPLLD